MINNIPSTVIDYIYIMPEWFKVLVSGTSHFDGMVSDTTPVMPHGQQFWLQKKNNLKLINNIPSIVLTILAGWPSGLRRLFQEPVISMAWVRIPLLSCYTVTN